IPSSSLFWRDKSKKNIPISNADDVLVVFALRLLSQAFRGVAPWAVGACIALFWVSESCRKLQAWLRVRAFMKLSCRFHLPPIRRSIRKRRPPVTVTWEPFPVSSMQFGGRMFITCLPHLLVIH